MESERKQKICKYYECLYVNSSFGMQHDGAGNLCGTPGQEPGRIMAARLTSDTDPFLWSNCSRQYITDFLE